MVIRFTIPGRPITKKNSQKIAFNKQTGKMFITQSDKYKQYEKDAGYFIPVKWKMINTPVNIKCLYYMPTHGKVDLQNLISSTMDILVKYGVIEDDNSGIVVGNDGSRVMYDKDNPRVEIEIDDSPGDKSVEHGKWMREPSDVIGIDVETCSVCGCMMNERNQFWDAKYCPYCGAKMDLNNNNV